MASSPTSGKTSTFFAILMLLVALGYCAVAFFPYRLTWPEYATNGAKWLDDGSLSFKSPGLALETGNEFPTRDLEQGESVEVLLDVNSGSQNQTGPARIASFSWNPHLRNLTIGQEGRDLVVRVRRLHADLNGQPNLKIPDVFASPGWHKIETHVRPDSVEVIIDGKSRLIKPNSAQAMASWDCSYPWVFGNERTGDRPWKGTIRTAEVCVDGKCLDVLEPDRLWLPDRYWITGWSSLVNPTELVSCTPIDMSINLFGFMPFGVLLVWLRRPTMGIQAAVIWATIFSLSLEVGQILVQSRYTSLIDVLCNVVGALIGYAAARRMVGMTGDDRSKVTGPMAIQSRAAH